ncbi:MAG: polyphosphate kinase 1 [Chloroflexi bacterium]|nr:polyphosphate kinase 1 [Chloroflexota bacterium]
MSIDLADPSLYFNRELSWVDFNERVLEEALDESLPLLERVNFLGIFSTNLDEFYMIRVAGLLKQIEAGVFNASVDGLTPLEQVVAIREAVLPLKDRQIDCWVNDLLPKLGEYGIRVLAYKDLLDEQQAALRMHFRQEILPVLTPLAVDPGRPFPHISNLSLNLAITLEDSKGNARFARLKVPTTDKIPRFVSLNEVVAHYGGSSADSPYTFLYLEDAIIANLDLLFPGMIIHHAYPFRVTRDADVEIAEDEASDLLATIEQGVHQRQFGDVVQLIITREMPEHIRSMLMEHLRVTERDVYELDPPLGLDALFEIAALELPNLKYPKFVPGVPVEFTSDSNIFDTIRYKDILICHPYESFDPTVDFIHSAAYDPNVLAIKISLYRVGRNSPIVKALLEARDEGKQVAVLVELKARFDEENNIVWAKALEAQGVHVVYGLVGLKTHAKIALVVRREGDVLRRYVHLSTGNYNDLTARVYSDIGLYSCQPELADDVTQLFNRITGYAPHAEYQKLLVAPEQLRHRFFDLVDRELKHAQAGHSARIIFKANSITDPPMIQKLYQASQAGLSIDMIIRGISRLRPGVPGVSENIQIRSIVGRFLEHARIYYFENNGDPVVYLGSADLMERNLDRRVEQLFPVEAPELKRFLYHVLQLQLADNMKARELQADGSWIRVRPGENDVEIDSQQVMITYRENLRDLPLFI